MFSRRHPYLFSLLVLSAIAAAAAVFISVAIFIFFNRSADSGLATEPGGEKVGIVELKGVITESRETLQLLKRFREDEAIRAIVLRIDSPGGVIGPAQEIYREVRKTVEKKAVVASMGAIAASGGYYVASAADGIMANPGTITGSIGVIITYTNFRELLDRIGLQPVVIKSGPYKDAGSPTRSMSAAEKDLLQHFVDQTHRQFVRAIAEGRGMPLKDVEKIADGRIFTGEEAQTLGFVDRMGNLEDAVQWAGRLAGITGPISTVYKRKEKFSLLRYLTETVLSGLKERSLSNALSGSYLLRPDAGGR